MARPVILTFIKYYLPGYKAGGPLRSIENLVNSLGDEFDFRIITLDRDLGEVDPYPQVDTGVWLEVGDAQVMYLALRDISIRKVRDIMANTHHDIVYLNSFFDVDFTAVPAICSRYFLRAQKPMIVAPRGEFSAGAISLKAWKKKPYLWSTRAAGLFRGVCWQASSEHEASDIRREFQSNALIKVASDLPAGVNAIRQTGTEDDAESSEFRILFVSRISPKKNLDAALQILARVTCRVSFTIVGPASDKEYHARCKQLSDQLPTNVSVEWRGSVENREVAGLMARHDLFFLPTRGENYGHVIAEALAAGTPVLLSDTTPWRDLEASGVGWDLPLEDESAFVAAIEASARKTASERAAWRSTVYDYARHVLSDPMAVEANRRLFKAVLVGQ